VPPLLLWSDDDAALPVIAIVIQWQQKVKSWPLLYGVFGRE